MQDFLCFAHRGASGHAPENTLAAFQKALELGCDWLELDVWMVEGELVVFHDALLDRTTNGRGRIEEQSLAYIRTLDAGKGERVPLLREVLDLVDGRAGINIELKGAGTALPAVSLIREYATFPAWGLNRFLVSSFDLNQLKELQGVDPDLPLGVLVEQTTRSALHLASRLHATSIHPELWSLGAAWVHAAQEQGLRVYPYTARTERDILRAKALGADGVFTDFPELVSRLASEGFDVC